MSKDYAKRSKQNHTRKKSGRATVSRRDKPKKKPVRNTTQVKRKQSKKQPKKSFFWRLLLVVVILVVIIAAAWELFNYQSTGTEKVVTKTGPVVVTAQPVKLATYEQRVTNPIKFTFKPVMESVASHSVYLQLGTYLQGDVALAALQTKLTQNNIHYSTVTFTRLGEIYYRIQIGPFKDQQQVLAKQKALQKQKIYSVIVTES